MSSNVCVCFSESVLQKTRFRKMTSSHVSEISSFFSGKCVLVTGGTGYMGKVLIEKLLRSCANIDTIFLLIRPKRGVEPAERMKTLLDVRVFKEIRQSSPLLLEKLHVMEGDVAEKGLLLSQNDVDILTQRVAVVFHLAAAVRFDQSLSSACRFNLGGTRNVLNLCHHMRALESVVYVSTAYSNCERSHIEEIVYPSSVDPDHLLQCMELMGDDFINSNQDIFIQDKPNTYTYTKFLCEKLIEKENGNLPLAIVRPSIVMSSTKEPFPGWTDSLYGPIGLSIMAGQGLIRVSMIETNKIVDFMPLDICINLIIAAAWNTVTRKPEDLQVYNCTSGILNPITHAEFYHWCTHYGKINPLESMVWSPELIVVTNKTTFTILDFLLHNIPARVIDMIMKMQGKTPTMYNFYEKFSRVGDANNYFILNEWTFDCVNVVKLQNSLSTEDRKLFNFDITKVVWPDYINHGIIGAKKFILNEPLENLPHCRKRAKRFLILHRLLQLGFLFIFYQIICWIWDYSTMNQ